jgi:hypothetical protein
LAGMNDEVLWTPPGTTRAPSKPCHRIGVAVVRLCGCAGSGVPGCCNSQVALLSNLCTRKVRANQHTGAVLGSGDAQLAYTVCVEPTTAMTLTSNNPTNLPFNFVLSHSRDRRIPVLNIDYAGHWLCPVAVTKSALYEVLGRLARTRGLAATSGELLHKAPGGSIPVTCCWDSAALPTARSLQGWLGYRSDGP